MIYLLIFLLIWFTRVSIKAPEGSLIKRLGLAIDDAISLLIFNNPGITLSAQTGLARKQGKLWGRLGSRFLNIFERDHTDKAIEADIVRMENNLRILKECQKAPPQDQ